MAEKNDMHNAIFPLSLSQRNIWNLEQLYRGTPINNISSTMMIRGRFDIPLLQKCLNAVIESDASLRTRIVVVNGQPFQYYADFSPEQFPVFDFSQTSKEGVSYWEEAVTREAMPLIDHPLYRFSIFRLGEQEGGVLLKTHHMITDGWSQVLFGNKLSKAYLAGLDGASIEIQPAPSYRRHVEAEEKYLTSNLYQKDRAYWENELSGAVVPASIKECKGADISPVGRRKTYTFSEVLNHAVQRFCDEKRVAPFTVFYMALAVYLKRIGGINKMSIGVPIYNRADFKEKQTTGMFVSTIPFINELDDHWTFEEFNANMGEKWFDLLRHQKFPFTDILKIARERHPGMENLFGIVLSYQNGKLFENEDASVSFSGRWHYSGYQGEDLVIHLSSLESSHRFSVDYDYKTQVFSEQEIDRLHNYLIKIIADAVAYPEKPISRLSLLSTEEEEKVLFGFNQTAAPVLQKTIAGALARVEREAPERVALICGGERIRYRALLSWVRAAAKEIEIACPGGGLVAVSLEKSAALIACMLGAAFAGGAWVIIPPDLPAERKKAILLDSGADLVIAEERQNWQGETPYLCVHAIGKEGGDRPPQAVSPDALAYVVYTSGSTGKPKGVEISQESLLNFAAGMRPLYGHGAVLSVCNIGFDAFLLESIVSLLNGCTVVLAKGEENQDPEKQAELIRGYGVGFLALTPSRLRAYLKNANFCRALRRVEAIVCGGEPLSGELVKDLSLLTSARVYNQYGPSEATIGVSFQLSSGAARITAGAPMPNCRLYVLDTNLQPMPTGVYGDLYLGGKCVGKGYRNAPELTAQNFLNSPFEPGERIYKTGDIAAWTQDGELLLGGREDGQVKIRGLRIETQEIAEYLARHPGVKEAAVLLSEGGGNPVLVAYYTAEKPLAEAELLKFLSMYLPGYMLPAQLVYLTKMPLTANGKVDFARLPKAVWKKSSRAAQSALEEQLQGILQEVLNRDDFGVESDYFAFGGDSLNAVEAICKIRESLGVSLTVSDFYTLRTVSRIAQSIGGEKGPAPADGIMPAPEMPTYPLSAIQQNIYFQAQVDPTGLSYNMPGAFQIGKGIDLLRLKEALRLVVEKEELFRTAFVLEKEGVRQKIEQTVDFSIETLRAQSFAEAKRAFVRPFDLAKAPLIRAALWQDGEETYLFIDTHHMISDGLSSRILIQRLNDAYCTGRVEMPWLTYKDFAYWAQGHAKKAAALPYWQDVFAAPLDPMHLPTDYPRKKTFDYQGETCVFPIGKELSAACGEFCKKQGLSLSMLLAAAYGILLAKISGKEDLVVGIPVSGRTDAALFNLFGAFINTLPLRLCPKSEWTVDAYLGHVKNRLAGMLDNQEVRLEELISLSGAKRSLTENTLYSTLFSFRPISEEEFILDGQKLTYLPIGTKTAKLDLSLEAAQTGDGTSIAIEYASALFSKETAALYARSFRQILEQMIAGGEMRLGDLEATALEDRMALFETPKYLRTPYVNLCLDEMVDRAGAVAPERPAVYTRKEMLTYRGLKDRAEQIAARLVEAGAKRGDYIGLSLKRTIDTLPAILGVLKAGCAYIPMLPSIPESRMRYMLELSGAAMVLCDGETEKALPKDLPCPAVTLDNERREFTPIPGRSAEDDIHIIFTSGSTGKPKGSVIQHKAIANLLVDVREKYQGITGNALCVSSMMFDTFLIESLLPLAAGIPVVLADDEEMLLPWKLAELVRERAVCATFMTPSRWQMCLKNDEFTAVMPRFEVVMAGGEVVSDQLVERFRAVSEAKIYNLYGPSEAAVYVASADITARKKSVIGRANPNCRLYVLDQNLRPVLPTAVGELYIAGECLARGYVGRPDLTAQMFVPDPFFPGERMYRSGDLVRLLADGNIDYIGREDQQVKLNGQRIELSEITGEMLGSGKVGEAAVIPVKKADDSMVLRAFFVPKDGAKADIAAVKEHLLRHLPKYMVPSSFYVLDKMPQTATGKTDLCALAQYEPDHPEEKEQHSTQEADSLKSRMVTIWQEVLEKKQVSTKESFFDQGGTSLAALNALGKYFQQGWKLTLADFYDHPTIEEQEKLIGEEVSGDEKQGGKAPAQEADSLKSRMVTVWQEVLEKKQVSTKESFFDQGGTSLAALNALGKYFQQGWKLTLADFYDHPTIEEQVALIGETAFLEQENDVKTAQDYAEDMPKEGAASAGDVLITGATGFLGAHLVRELAEKGKRCYCLVRGEEPDRLQRVLSGYFGQAWVKAHEGGIQAVRGDLCEELFGLTHEEWEALLQKIGLVVHAAADVRHYAPEEELSRVNYEGTCNLLAFCRAGNAKLAHISTMSVCGEYLERNPEQAAVFTEVDFDIGQNWKDNVYTKTKYLAEKAVRAAAEHGMDVKIFRVGRLVGRSSDGVFQNNPESNSFFAMIRGFSALGCFPESYAQTPMELTPVDECARAIVTLLDASGLTYHLANPNTVPLCELFREIGAQMDQTPADVFEKRLLTALAGPEREKMFAVVEIWNSASRGRQRITATAALTQHTLTERGFLWSRPEVRTVLKAFKGDR